MQFPDCPLCKQLPWRPGHVAAVDCDGLEDGTYTVCYHCATPLKLRAEEPIPGIARVFWQPLSEAEIATMPVLGAAAAYIKAKYLTTGNA